MPDFIAVGPVRTGTIWLDRVLRSRVGLPLGRKESDFFKRNYVRGIDWYLDYFRECPPNLPRGEVCPTYFALEQSRERIAAPIPGCRIIVTLRDPVERAGRDLWHRKTTRSQRRSTNETHYSYTHP